MKKVKKAKERILNLLVETLVRRKSQHKSRMELHLVNLQLQE